MNGFFTRVLAACFIAMVAMHAPVAAEWQQNGNNLTPWCATYPKACSDGEGGAIVVFQDYDHGYGSPYALRVDGNGNQLWGGVCVPLSWPHTTATGMCIVADGAGGAVVAWQDTRSGEYDVYAQRVSASGAILWNPSGVPVCTAPTDQTQIAMVSDGRGGALIAWTDDRNGNKDIYHQRVDPMGTCIFGPGGVDGQQITNDPLDQSFPAVVGDGNGGAIIVWQDERSGFSDIYATKFNETYGWTWGGVNGAPVCTAASYQQAPVVAPDDAGGVVIFWYDTRGGGSLYGQRMSSIGNARWMADGIPVASPGNTCYPKSAVSDGAGSVYVGWVSYSYTTWSYSVYAQKVSRAGILQWQSPGLAFSSGEGDQNRIQLLSLGTSGIIAAWDENRFGSIDLFAQKVSPAGQAMWTADGVALCDAFGNQAWPSIVTDGAEGAIIAWVDDPVASCMKWRAQRVTAEGFWGYPAPHIAGVRDIPGDQGGSVNLAWDASRLDPAPEHLIDHYTIWRAISPTAAAPLLAGGARLIADASELEVERGASVAAAEGASGAGGDADARPETRVLRAAMLNGEPYYWDLVLTTNAYYLSKYSKVVPTLFDSTETSAEHQYFQVIAHTDDPYVFYVSEPDSGRSVDNLAPAPPAGLAGEQIYVPTGLNLAWDPNVEPDLDRYRVYRGTSAGFIPGPSNLLGSTADTTLFDGGWTWKSGYYYKVAAVDIHGNVSGCALLTPDGVTDVETPKTPEAAYLRQNYPNPFNPTTRITFGLGAPGNVSLRIYDAAGRLVRVLAEGARAAGNYAELWDGRDSNGRAVASGIYFYRLTAGAFTETRKMALLR